MEHWRFEMTTLDRPYTAIASTIDPPGSRFLCRASVFGCEPKYRILRAVTAAGTIHAYRRHGSRAMFSAQWHAIRTHSSWSRA